MLGIMTVVAAGASLPLAAGPNAVAASGSASGRYGSAPADLRVGSRVEPLGTETAPTFSWVPPVARQTAYEIQVGSGPGRGDVWRSGKVKGAAGADSVEVRYGGGALRSDRAYFWRVRTWDEKGAVGAWSEPSVWETGLLKGEKDWSGARWIGGRVAQDHDWRDLSATVVFRGGSDAASGLSLMLRAEPIGKTWGEGLVWTLRQSGDTMQLAMRTSHYAGNTWVDDGTSEPDWGVDHYDSQSETNPTTAGTRGVVVGAVDLPASTGLTKDTWGTRDHTVKVEARGLTVTTTVNGVEVDSRTLTGDQIRRHGSFGFAGGNSATVRSVRVTGTGARDFAVDLTTGANPFEHGIPTPTGLTFPPKNPFIPARNSVLPIANPAPVLRRAFDLPQGRRIAKARLHLSAAGNVTFTVNGDPITVDGERADRGGTNVPRLLTDQSTYDRTVLYDTFDITGLLRAGRENVVAAELGRGWYGVTTPQEWYWQLAPYAGQPRLRAKLVVTYTDGSHTTLVTDEDWLASDGPTTFDSVYSGEKYDARRAEELGEWRSVDYQAGREWRPATVLIAPGSCAGPSPKHHGALPATTVPEGFTPAVVRAHEAEPVLVDRTLRPVALTESAPGSGVWILDYGQILTGLVRLDLTGVGKDKQGLTLRIRGGNRITAGDGTAGSPFSVEEENFQHDANLQTHYYTVGKRSTQSWEQQFSHFGFRYLEVMNLEAVLGRKPDLKWDAGVLTVGVARSGFARTGTFTTDNALLNRLQSNLEWAERNNLVQKPTDTPSREKNGWTGDAMASSESESLTWDVNALLTNYLRQFPDTQISTGQLPMFVPIAKGGYGYDRTPGWNATWKAVPAWDSAYFVIPRELYTYYGNSGLFAELYDHQDTLLKYYETLFTAENDYKFEASLGAYSGAEKPGSNAVISLAFYIYFCDYMDEVGRGLGRTGRAAHYAKLARTLRKAYIANYWDASLGYFTQGSISSENVLAIAFDLVPGSDLKPDDPRHLPGRTVAENKKALAKLLADRIVAADQHLQNDMYGSRYEFNILSEYGYTDVALKAVTQTGQPGYVYQIAKGATSLWEQWTDRLSVNHHYRSNVATWFYQSLAGIRPTSVAYETLRIRPYIPAAAVNSRVPKGVEDTDLSPATLDDVSASIDTVRGTVSSRWRRRKDGRIDLAVTIPYNTEAEIWVPTQGKPVAAPQGVTFVRDAGSGGADYKVYRARAGSYRFNAG